MADQKNKRGRGVIVVGLGRFGGALAATLAELGHEVLGVDSDPGLVQRHASVLTHVIEADTTDLATLRQIGAADFRHAVVGIGTDIEASILTTSSLVDLDVPDIWAKATTERHGQILQRVGAHHVVFPERDMGLRVAHLVTGRMLDYVRLDDDFAIVETSVPAAMLDRTLAEAEVRAAYGINVMAVKPKNASFTHATADTIVRRGDILLVAGPTRSVEQFAELD